MKISLYLLIIVLLVSCQDDSKETINNDEQYVVMLSLDGFRWDYAEMTNTPNLDYLAQNGVKADYLQPCFPSKTFPNHYSIATGLYPDNHGLVNNSFYDWKMDKWYSISNRNAVGNPDFYDGEPIWVTAEKQGLKSASYFWVGSEAPIKGMHPTYWKTYDHDVAYSSRIDSVVYWLNKPIQQRPRLVTFYVSEPDGIGHRFGPESQEVVDKVKQLDAYVGECLTKLKSCSVADSINFIIVSDHGMGATHPDRVVALDKYLNLDWCDIIVGSNPVYNISPKQDYIEEVYDALKSVPHVQVFKNDEFPEKYNYGGHYRTLTYTVVADKEWSVIKSGGFTYAGGAHGYLNDNEDMYGIFYAMGPSFKKGLQYKGFENIEIYNLLCDILKIEPSSNDGELSLVKEMLD